MTLWALFWLGAEVVSPGSQNYTSVGTFYFTVPNYNTLTVDCRGAGGGGSGGVVSGVTGGTYTGSPGTGGGVGRFASNTAVVGNGANPGGIGSVVATEIIKAGTSYADYPGSNASNASGSGPAGVSLTPGGGSPGGLGGLVNGPWDSTNTDGTAAGGNGGNGGRAVMTFNKGDAGAPVPGTSITVTVQSGGNAGVNNDYIGSIGFSRTPSAGNAASVLISWA